ncbi:hypothetical protein [Chryseobacterium lacus]|uniref:hypothetical protein n=1 Tax=Chryseobacterium lacus TaxID=2058346 RepID=UPI000F888E92|nr:hypothetical protein [Chryseobacterium lacus]RST26838.1 hypothetical protein EIZ46_06220 [Chryseobacterium lacus]
MKKILALSFCVFSVFFFGQNVKLKKDVVYINGKQCMKYSSKELGSSTTFSSLEGKRLFYIDVAKNDPLDRSYYKIQFAGSNDIITTPATGLNYRAAFIKNMISEGVINPANCEVNLAHVTAYGDRYHQDFTIQNNPVIIINNPPQPTRSGGVNVNINR